MNKIEQLERAIEGAQDLQTQKQLASWYNANERKVREALELSLEIAKGEAHVMRYEPLDEHFRNNKLDDKEENVLLFRQEDRGGAEYHEVFNYNLDFHDSETSGWNNYGDLLGWSDIEKPTHYATFNNSPVIPKPKENKDV